MKAGHPNRSAIEARQLSKIRALLAVLVPDNPFYSKKLKVAGKPSNTQSLEQFSELVPFTSRQEVIEDQRENPPYGTNLTHPLDHYTRMHQTSGTSGTPMRWLDTPESWNWMLDNWARVYKAAGVGCNDRIFFAFSFGPFLGFWTAFESATRLGCLCLPGGGLRSAARLQSIIDNGATVLCCTPTYAIHLADVAAEEKIDLEASQVKVIIVAGEPGAGIASTRALIERRWNGARVVDHHGMTEIGPVSYECPKRRGVLHVIESAFYPEVVDPQSEKPVGDGEMGELVLTNLGREGSPLLRYRTGDLVTPERPEPCVCGSHELALLGGIAGRADDMIIVRGVSLFPSAIEEIVRSVGDVAEYRVEIGRKGAMTEVNILIEPTPGCPDVTNLAQRLEAALDTSFSLRIPVSAMPPGSLPRFELKAARWVRV